MYYMYLVLLDLVKSYYKAGPNDYKINFWNEECRNETFSSKVVEESKKFMKNGRILVMDDHKDIRYIFRILLNRSPYEVEVAEDGNEAIECFKCAIEADKPFDAVILDFNVPGGMGGAEATKRLLEIDPVARVIWCSGSISNPIMINYLKYGAVAIIHKPFNSDDIHGALSKAISRSRWINN